MGEGAFSLSRDCSEGYGFIRNKNTLEKIVICFSSLSSFSGSKTSPVLDGLAMQEEI